MLSYFTNYAQEVDTEWATHLGGVTGNTSGRGIAVDGEGNSVTTGFFASTVDFDPSDDSLMISSAGGFDFYIQKLSPAGELIWVQTFGDNYGELAFKVIIDNEDNIYVTGYFYNTIDFDPSDEIYELTPIGDVDVFILKLSSEGEFIWAKSFGGEERDVPVDFNFDEENNLLLLGEFRSTIDIDPGASVFELTAVDDKDIFLQKLTREGNFIWGISVGGSSLNIAGGVICDSNNNVYIAGSYSGSVDFNPGPETFYLSPAGPTDIFLLKLNSLGEFIWAKTLGGVELMSNVVLELDVDDNVIVVGQFRGEVDFDLGDDEFLLDSPGNFDLFILKLDPAANFMWVKNYEGNFEVIPLDIGVDEYNNILIAGQFAGSLKLKPYPDLEILYSELDDILILKLNEDGDHIWGKKIGGSGTQAAYGVVPFGSESIYITGQFQQSVDFDTSEDSLIFTCQDSNPNAFTVKFGPYDLGFEESLNENFAFKMYPNPTNGMLYLEANYTENASVSIYDITGKIIFQEKLTQSTIHSINLDLKAGVYIVEFIAEGLSQTQKLVVN